MSDRNKRRKLKVQLSVTAINSYVTGGGRVCGGEFVPCAGSLFQEAILVSC